MTRIAVIGAGAVGSTLGGLLSRAGNDVTLIGRAAHVAAIRSHGLTIACPSEIFTVHVSASEQLDFRPDLALLAVKTQDVLPALQANLAHLADVPLLTLQNGIQSHTLASSLIPVKNIISVVVMLNASYLTPGEVTLAYSGGLVIGRPYATRDAQVDQAAEILNRAIPTRISNSVMAAHWLKLIVNLNNALPALTNYSMSLVYGDTYLRNLALIMMREGLRVTKQAGISLESLPDVSAVLARLIALLPMNISGPIVAAKVRRMETKWPLYSSTLQSILRRRLTEIDYLNGEVVRLGRQFRIDTLVNARIVELVHEVEQSKEFISVDGIRQRLSSR